MLVFHILTVRRRLPKRLKHELVRGTDEDKVYYEITKKGRQFFTGDLDPNELKREKISQRVDSNDWLYTDNPSLSNCTGPMNIEVRRMSVVLGDDASR